MKRANQKAKGAFRKRSRHVRNVKNSRKLPLTANCVWTKGIKRTVIPSNTPPTNETSKDGAGTDICVAAIMIPTGIGNSCRYFEKVTQTQKVEDRDGRNDCQPDHNRYHAKVKIESRNNTVFHLGENLRSACGGSGEVAKSSTRFPLFPDFTARSMTGA